VKLVYEPDKVLEKLVAEGASSPADVLLTNEFGPLLDAREKGLTEAFTSSVVDANVPAIYRDPEQHWVGLTRRARIIITAPQRLQLERIAYEQLADPRFKGRLCMRSATHAYNTALIASMLQHHGAARAETWLRGVKANLARKPAGGDRDQIRALLNGECDIAVVHSTYAANHLFVDQDGRALEQNRMHIVFPNADDRGTQVTISGVALLKTSRNKAAAIKFIELLTTPLGQRMYSVVNDEYPVHPDVEAPQNLQSWGALKADTVSLHKVANLRRQAVDLAKSIGFDEVSVTTAPPTR
jgi:iron(III) transport system substrate-binding protein